MLTIQNRLFAKYNIGTLGTPTGKRTLGRQFCSSSIKLLLEAALYFCLGNLSFSPLAPWFTEAGSQCQQRPIRAQLPVGRGDCVRNKHVTEATANEMQPQDFCLSTREDILFLSQGVELARPSPRTSLPESKANRGCRNGERRRERAPVSA